MLSVYPGDILMPVPTAIEKAIGYRPHPSTCTRWTHRGVGGVILETAQVGGRPKTTQEAVLDFVRRRTAAEAPDGHRRDPQPFGRNEDRIRRADQQLERDGV